MADILIRGWRVPKGCGVCPLNTGAFYCAVLKRYAAKEENVWMVSNYRRLKDCPLIVLPEHGDLIDRDAFRSENEYYLNREFINPKYEDTLDDLLKDAPVVIPSNKEV